MSKEFNELVETIENANSITSYCVKQIQDLILSDESLQSISKKIKSKLSGAELLNFNIWLKNDKYYDFTLEVSTTSSNEIQIVYFRINQTLEITDYNYKYEFQDMKKISLEIKEILKKYYE